MTIEIQNADLKRLLEERLDAGDFESVEELLLEALSHGTKEALGPNETPSESLVAFFRRSPLVGLELDLERDRDIGRDIVL